MGALVTGYDGAHKRHDETVAEARRKEGLADDELVHLKDLMNQDSAFLKDNEVTYDIAQRTMRVAHRRAPMATIRYNVEVQEYVVTVMYNGSHATPKTTEDCARVIGEVLFAVSSSK